MVKEKSQNWVDLFAQQTGLQRTQVERRSYAITKTAS